MTLSKYSVTSPLQEHGCCMKGAPVVGCHGITGPEEILETV